MTMLAVIAAACLVANCTAFVPSSSRAYSRMRLADGKLAGDKERNEGYGPLGSLTRQGPVPFFIRLSKPDVYEQAVNKYMLLEKCDRKTAQGELIMHTNIFRSLASISSCNFRRQHGRLFPRSQWLGRKQTKIAQNWKGY